MFKSQPILIVEDEPIIGHSLADAVVEMGGEPIGPFATVKEATDAIACVRVSAAILDAKLLDGEVTPVALQLADRAVPMVVHSGTGIPAEVAQQWPHIPLICKPAPARVVVESLCVAMAEAIAMQRSSQSLACHWGDEEEPSSPDFISG